MGTFTACCHIKTAISAWTEVNLYTNIQIVPAGGTSNFGFAVDQDTHFAYIIYINKSQAAIIIRADNQGIPAGHWLRMTVVDVIN